VLSYDEMRDAIGPDKTHCTWYKVLMMKRLLNDTEYLERNKIQVRIMIRVRIRARIRRRFKI
jgi:hypothetical protein